MLKPAIRDCLMLVYGGVALSTIFSSINAAGYGWPIAALYAIGVMLLLTVAALGLRWSICAIVVWFEGVRWRQEQRRERRLEAASKAAIAKHLRDEL